MTTVDRDEMREQVTAAMAARQKKRNEGKNDKKGLSKKARPGFKGKVYGKGKLKLNTRGGMIPLFIIKI